MYVTHITIKGVTSNNEITPLIVLKNKTIHRVLVTGENGFPLQATCFPVGERIAAPSAVAPFRGLPVSLSHGSQVAFHSNLQNVTFLAEVFK